jgi:hypothetical protein
MPVRDTPYVKGENIECLVGPWGELRFGGKGGGGRGGSLDKGYQEGWGLGELVFERHCRGRGVQM